MWLLAFSSDSESEIFIAPIIVFTDLAACERDKRQEDGQSHLPKAVCGVCHLATIIYGLVRVEWC